MKAFAALLDRLVLTPQRNAKITLLTDYFRATPDPDRGYALAALAGTLTLKTVKPALLRELVLERMDDVLFRYSYDYVGDLAETIALVWQPAEDVRANRSPPLGEVIDALQSAGRTEVRGLVRTLLDRLDASERFAFLKLVTGGFRIGVSARLARQALADFGGVEAMEIETLWHGVDPPYVALFQWLEGKAEKPEPGSRTIFHPVMLAHPVEDRDLAAIAPEDYAAEWKWDGIRIQLSGQGGDRRLYSRSGDDISHAFPDIVEAADFEGVIDGELLIGRASRAGGATRSFSDLQQRLNRKAVSKAMLAEYPAFVRAYDLLFDGSEDIRAETFLARRARLAAVIDRLPAERFDLSPLVPFDSWEALERLRADPPDPVIEGVMIKGFRRPTCPAASKAPGSSGSAIRTRWMR